MSGEALAVILLCIVTMISGMMWSYYKGRQEGTQEALDLLHRHFEDWKHKELLALKEDLETLKDQIVNLRNQVLP